MPTVHPELAEDEFVPDDDLQEAIGDTAPASETFSRFTQEATVPYTIPANKRRSFIRWVLGFDQADEADPWRLRREVPQPHPVYPWLYAESATSVGIAPNPTEGTDNKPQEPALFDALGIDRVAKYQKALVTVRFRDIGNMRMLPDEDIDDYQDEWKRFTRWHVNPTIEALQADGSSQLVFAEGVGPVQPTAGVTAFPAPVATLLAKADFVLEWSAPHEYVSADPQILLPVRFLNAMGKVNSTDFLGAGSFAGAGYTNFPAGTLLMQPPKFEPFKYPVASTDPYQPFIGWRIFVPFQRFDPEKGVPASAYRGHNLMPWRNDGKWYYATRDGTTSGSSRPLIQSTEFLDIFKHVNAP